MFTVTYAWITQFSTERGGYNRKQIDAIGVDWPLKKGWKLQVEGKKITEENRAIFESFAGENVGKSITGEFYKPSGKCLGCVPPWEVCEFPCPDAI